MITGAITSSVAAIVRFHCTWCSERNSREPDRQHPVVRVLAGVEQRQEEVVERVEEREQRHRGDRRLREPQHDGDQDPQLAAAVDARRVEVLLRDRQEELPQQEDRERVAEPVRDDHAARASRRRCELRPHHVERHDRHLRRQHQRDQHDHERRRRAPPAQARERVGDRDARDEQAERREARVHRACSTSSAERRLREDVDEVAPAERVRPELRRQRLVVRHQRGQRDEDERREERDRGGDQQRCGSATAEQERLRRTRRGRRGGGRTVPRSERPSRVTAPPPGSAPSGASCARSRASPRRRRRAAAPPSPTRSPSGSRGSRAGRAAPGRRASSRAGSRGCST